MRGAILGVCLLVAATAAYAETAGNCSIAVARWEGKMEFSWDRGDCGGREHCNEGNSDMEWVRWTGIAPSDLQHEGAAIDARLTAEPGEMRCVGKVHDGALQGAYSFTPNADFVKKMEAMGFDGQTQDRLQGYTFLDVTTAWVRELKDAHVRDLTTEKLMGLRALRVDAAYVRAMAADGYPELGVDKLTSMKAVGVTPEKVKAVRAMGYSPSEEELIQMSVFKIDAPFVERMKARGFKTLTIAQLVQIKVFKLDE
jgi:hypothetical protein